MLQLNNSSGYLQLTSSGSGNITVNEYSNTSTIPSSTYSLTCPTSSTPNIYITSSSSSSSISGLQASLNNPSFQGSIFNNTSPQQSIYYTVPGSTTLTAIPAGGRVVVPTPRTYLIYPTDNLVSNSPALLLTCTITANVSSFTVADCNTTNGVINGAGEARTFTGMPKIITNTTPSDASGVINVGLSAIALSKIAH